MNSDTAIAIALSPIAAMLLNKVRARWFRYLDERDARREAKRQDSFAVVTRRDIRITHDAHTGSGDVGREGLHSLPPVHHGPGKHVAVSDATGDSSSS